MKLFMLIAALSFPMPAFAQQEGEVEEGFSLMEEGARLLFLGIISEMDPAIEEFSDLAQDLEPALEFLATEMGPALMDLIQTLDSVRFYERPEILPNGDIIIRRSPDAPQFTPAPVEENDVIDL